MKYVVAVYYKRETGNEGLFCDLIDAKSKHDALVYALENIDGFFSNKNFIKLYWHVNENKEDE